MRKNNNVGAAISRPHIKEITKRKNETGITLIALVITIIVMVIIVAVSIQVAMESGLFGAAGKAVKEYKEEQEKEGNMKITIGDKTYNSIEEYLNQNPNSILGVNVKLEHTPVEVTADGTKVSSITEGAPIPKDFYYVGGTMNTGIVISDNSADENKGADADLTGNQFVWVPVLQNQKITLDIKTEQAMIGIKITDPKGTEIMEDASGNTIDVVGKTSYSCVINPTINGEYKVTVNLGSDTSGDSGDAGLGSGVGSGVTGSGSGSGSGDAGLGSGVTDTAPEIVATLDVSSLYAQDFFGESGTYYTDDATIATYAESVNTYGGFYIARYEAGSENTRTSSSGTTDTVYSKKNMYPYNYINKTNAITKASGMYSKTNVTSSLVNAAAWDRTLNWLIETKAVTETEVIDDSKSWGNYRNSEFEFTGKYSINSGDSFTNSTTSTEKPTYANSSKFYLLGTGVSDYTKRNNIYDLAGNCFEWTTEANSSSGVVNRGGVYDDYGVEYPASVRLYTSATDSYNILVFRSVLYIN